MMTMKADERLQAAEGVLQYLRDTYKNITVSDSALVLKIAQTAVYQNQKNEPLFGDNRL